VLERLYEHPIVSVNEARDWIGTSYPAARRISIERNHLQGGQSEVPTKA
jgi:hypothetical protein